MFLVLFFPSVDGAPRQQPKPELVNARLMVLKTELNSVFVSGNQSRRFTNNVVFLVQDLRSRVYPHILRSTTTGCGSRQDFDGDFQVGKVY